MSSNHTVTSSTTAIFHGLRAFFVDLRYFWVLATLVIVGDAVLTELIIRFVPCQHPIFLLTETER
jgi:hypothetical protein